MEVIISNKDFFYFSAFLRFPKKQGIKLVEVYLNFEMSQVIIVHPGSTVGLIPTPVSMRDFVCQSIYQSVGPSVHPRGKVEKQAV